MTNEEILFMANNLTAVDAPEMDAEFNYYVSANLNEAERVAKNIREAIKPGEKLEEYDKEVQALREKYATKDEKGNPNVQIIKLPNGQQQRQYDIPGGESKTSEFGKALEKLRTKYKKDLDDQKEKMKFLEKENKEFKPVMIDLDDVPKGLNRQAMDALFYVIKKPEKK